MPPEVLKALAKALGLADTATEAQVKKRLRALGLAENTDVAIVEAVASAAVARAQKPGRVIARGQLANGSWIVRAAGEDVVEVLIYGDIGESWYGESVTAKAFVEQLQGIKAETINVRINSYGGSVSDGIAIYNALKRHPAEIIVDIDGVAISIASMIAMAGDTVRMADNARYMVHAPWGAASGNAEQMRQYADVLDGFAEAMSSAYIARTGKPDQVLALLKDGADHWYSPQEALAFGFVDEITPSLAAAASFKPSRFRDPTAAAVISTQESSMNFKALAAALGIQVAGMTDAQIKAAVLKSLKLADAASDADVQAALDARNTPPAAETAEQAVARVQARNTEIRAVFAAFRARNGVQDIETECLANAGMTVEQARNKLLAHLGAGAEPLGGAAGSTQVLADARDKFVAGASQALAARANLEKRDNANEYNGKSLPELAAQCIVAAGGSIRGLSKDGIARKVLASMTTGDFPLLLSSTAGKALRAAYEGAPSTFQLWCGIGEVSDFKAHPRIQMGSFNSLPTKPEGEEYAFGQVNEEAESITAVTKGRVLRMSREMIVNDDLGAFTKRAQMLGRAARRTVNEDVYTLLTSGAGNDGPTMSDTGQLFNTTAITTAGGHANKSATSDAVTVASIAAGRAAMRKQRAKGATVAAPGELLNVMPRYLLAPVGKEDIIWAVLNSTSDPSSSNSAKRNYVKDVAQLVLVTDPLLDGVSATAWWLAADPMDAPLIEVDFLDGNQTPFIDEAVNFLTDALDLKVRLDYGLAAIDYRAGWKNPGA